MLDIQKPEKGQVKILGEVEVVRLKNKLTHSRGGAFQATVAARDVLHEQI
jgi:hypothetical protein